MCSSDLACEPGKAVNFFINGSEKGLDTFVERLRQSGYSALSQSLDFEGKKIIEAPVLNPVQRWLRLLEAY